MKTNNLKIINILKLFKFFLFIRNSNKFNLILLVFFLLSLAFATIIFYYLYIRVNPYIIDADGNLEIFKINNEFGPYIKSIVNDVIPKLNFVGIDLYSARRPVLPYFILLVWENITKQFLLILLIKNLIFGGLLFYAIKIYTKNNFFLLIFLIIIFYNPHNSFTMIDIGIEEGFLNYSIIILFFLLLSKHEYKSIFISIILSFIFFTKDSAFIFTFVLAVSYIFMEEKKKYFPLIVIIFSNLIWGFYTYKLNNNFAIGPTGSSFNTLNLANVYQKEFVKTYPQIRPDINYVNIEKYLKESNVSNEDELNDILIKKSINFIINNPSDVFLGLVKKTYVITLSPFKDAQYPDENGYVINPIRYSNFSNKFVFNLSLLILFYQLLKKSKKKFKNKDYYYLLLVVSYFFPYMIAFVYPRHCTSIYTISHLYVLIYLVKKYDWMKKINKLNHKILNCN